MQRRVLKRNRVAALKSLCLAGHLTQDQVDTFALVYGRAKTEADVEQVDQAVQLAIDEEHVKYFLSFIEEEEEEEDPVDVYRDQLGEHRYHTVRNALTKQSLVVLMDVDGVLANFRKRFEEEATRIMGKELPLEASREWRLLAYVPEKYHNRILEACSVPGFCRSLEPFHGAVAGVEKVMQHGDLFVVTSPWTSRTWVYERTEWLGEHFQIPPEDILHVAAKRKPLVSGDVFIDDKLETVVSWAKNNPRGLPIVWDRPYNQGKANGVLRVFSWLHLNAVLDHFHSKDEA